MAWNSDLIESVTRATLHGYYEFVFEVAMDVVLLNLDLGVEPRQFINLKDKDPHFSPGSVWPRSIFPCQGISIITEQNTLIKSETKNDKVVGREESGQIGITGP